MWHPSQCSQSLTFFLSLLYVPCCQTWLCWLCQIFTSFRYETRALFSCSQVLFIQGNIERYFRGRTSPYFLCMLQATLAWGRCLRCWSTVPQRYRGVWRIIGMPWWGVNFDRSFPKSPPLLHSISKWSCLRNWFQFHESRDFFCWQLLKLRSKDS